MKTGNHVLETVDLLNPTDFRKCEIDIVISIIPITFISAYNIYYSEGNNNICVLPRLLSQILLDFF